VAPLGWFAWSPVARRWLVGLLSVAVLGCSSGITVRSAAGPDLLTAWRASIAEADELSPRTRQTLRRWDLDGRFQERPAEAYACLQALATQDPQPDLLFALAEISFLLGRRAETRACSEACAYYYFSAGYAYHFLFDNRDWQVEGHNPRAMRSSVFDPRFRLACDLYNTSLAKCIRAAQRTGQLDPRQELHLPGRGGEFILSVSHHAFPWQPAEFGPLLFCADYNVVGLDNQYRGYGLGVALIGTRIHDPKIAQAPGHAFYPDDVSFPVTAFFRFEGSLADLGARRSGRLELYNPLEIQAVEAHGRPIPLETDLTTPLAYFLAHTDLEGIEYTGFLNADKIKKRSGLYMFEPYQPGKVPVVMVHGLLSSPLTWAPMFNDLRADPTLRKHFQFWFYLYPTGDPYLLTAADLRQDLAELRAALDPDGHDRTLDQMVFVGHSMGGLVSKLLTVDGGEDFWRLASSVPLHNLRIRPQTQAELERVFYFQRQPFVRRVVFIGTPHHGSKLSPSWPARLAVKFVQMPRELLKAAHDVAQENPDLTSWLTAGRLPTSVDLLAPDAPALELLATRPRPPDVHYHSIIGDIYGAGANGSDGIVTARSAHLDGVDSEILEPADHFQVHHHPRAVLEVRRILLEHLQEVRGLGQASAPTALPVTHSPAN
jgi:pimeloyl-ACP methyl ester carboxylesterase